jgi:hypothetical protein
MGNVVTQTLHFDPAGATLSVRMTAGQAAAGHYTLTLLEHDGFTVVKDFGIVKFGSPGSNTHALPSPASANDGRILQAVTSVGIMDSGRNYAVFLDLMQSGKKIGTVSDHGPDTGGTSDTVESELDAVLSRAPAVMALNASATSLLAPGARDIKTARSRKTKARTALRSRTRRLLKSSKPKGRKRSES